MTKSAFVNTQEKVQPAYTAVQLSDPAPLTQEEECKTTCWYVLSILSTIFCCLPCGVIGMVHAVIAKHEGERRNYAGHRQRLHQAKCWTSWSIVVGLVFAVLMTLYALFYMYMGFIPCPGGWYGDDFFNYDGWNQTSTTTTVGSTSSTPQVIF